MKKYISVFFVITILFRLNAGATTWNEPWAEKVIREADSFVLAKIISSDEEKGIKMYILKTLGGAILKDTVVVNNFYLLKLCSSSGGHGAEFITRPVDSCYFFIKKNARGEYCIATPTTGYDYVNEGNVSATFRHSYHQASVPVSIYEMTMTAVFNNYHHQSHDKGSIEKFVNENLSKSPAGFSQEELNTFFLQHVALEVVYHLKLGIPTSVILPFLNDSDNFHNQVSGARALRAVSTEDGRQVLLNAISDTTKRGFVRVMCVWSIAELNTKGLKKQLAELSESASDEDDGFGGNIMDPRVCTHIPSIKRALEDLIAKLD